MKNDKDIIGTYEIIDFPKERIPTLDFLAIGDNKHYIKGLFEVDVTKGRRIIKSYEKEHGIKLSFTAWLLKCIGTAASEFKEVHSMMKGRNKIISFDDVDISIAVEKETKSGKAVIPLVIRKANIKSVRNIHNEIRAAQSEEINGATVLGEHSIKNWIKYYVLLPKSVRRFIIKKYLKNPFRIKKLMGTIIVTAVGMFGNMHGWAIPTTSHPLAFAVGGITEVPRIKDNKFKIHEYLTITVLFNHDVVDGAPATRFINRLKNLIESNYGLDDL